MTAATISVVLITGTKLSSESDSMSTKSLSLSFLMFSRCPLSIVAACGVISSLNNSTSCAFLALEANLISCSFRIPRSCDTLSVDGSKPKNVSRDLDTSDCATYLPQDILWTYRIDQLLVVGVLF